MAESEAVREGVGEGAEKSRKRKTESSESEGSEVEQRKRRKTESPEAEVKKEVLSHTEDADITLESGLKEGDPSLHHRPSLSNWAKSSSIAGIPGISVEIFTKYNIFPPASTTSLLRHHQSTRTKPPDSDSPTPGISPTSNLIKEPNNIQICDIVEASSGSGATISDPVSDTQRDRDKGDPTTSGASITGQVRKPQILGSK